MCVDTHTLVCVSHWALSPYYGQRYSTADLTWGHVPPLAHQDPLCLSQPTSRTSSKETSSTRRRSSPTSNSLQVAIHDPRIMTNYGIIAYGSDPTGSNYCPPAEVAKGSCTPGCPRRRCWRPACFLHQKGSCLQASFTVTLNPHLRPYTQINPRFVYKPKCHIKAIKKNRKHRRIYLEPRNRQIFPRQSTRSTNHRKKIRNWILVNELHKKMKNLEKKVTVTYI